MGSIDPLAPCNPNKTVVYCNYCTEAMTVGANEVPDDVMYEICKDARKEPEYAKMKEEIEESGVEVGVRVEYNGHEWKAAEWGPDTMIWLERYNFESGKIENQVACCTSVEVVDKADSDTVEAAE